MVFFDALGAESDHIFEGWGPHSNVQFLHFERGKRLPAPMSLVQNSAHVFRSPCLFHRHCRDRHCPALPDGDHLAGPFLPFGGNAGFLGRIFAETRGLRAIAPPTMGRDVDGGFLHIKRDIGQSGHRHAFRCLWPRHAGLCLGHCGRHCRYFGNKTAGLLIRTGRFRKVRAHARIQSRA